MCPCSRWREMKGWNKKAFNFKIQQKELPPSQIETLFMFSSLNNGCVLKFNVAIQIFMLRSNINKGNLLETIQGNNTSTQKSLKFWEKEGLRMGIWNECYRTKVLYIVLDMVPFLSLVWYVLGTSVLPVTVSDFSLFMYTWAKNMFKILINLTFIYVNYNINLTRVGQHMFNEQYKEIVQPNTSK